MTSPIPLFDSHRAGAPRILQLAQDLELFSDGEPPANTLFVLGRIAQLSADSLIRDQFLLVDPPVDVTQRFRFEGDLAVIFTGDAVDVGAPMVQTAPGGVAHVRIGEHYLDIYAERSGVIVYLPATGVLLGGGFGSDALPPSLAAGSDGSSEMDALRLLARLLKTQHFQLYIPRFGTLLKEKPAVMARFAEDVSYIHALRRIAPGLAQRQEPVETIERVAESLLPPAWRSELAREIHMRNMLRVVEAMRG